MARIYTTAQGKQLDIESLRVANEETIAVGNMKVNARGDLLGSGSSVAVPRNQLMDQVYATRPPVIQEGASVKQLSDLASNLTVPVQPNTEDIDIPTPTPSARGALADSLEIGRAHV